MEDVFKAMGDAINPNFEAKSVIDRLTAFYALLKAIDDIPDIQIRMNIRDKMIDYINSKY